MNFKVIYDKETGEVKGFCKPESVDVCTAGRGAVDTIDIEVEEAKDLMDFVNQKVNIETKAFSE